MGPIEKSSYEACRALADEAGSNFVKCFRFLRDDRRDAMYAIYAMFRHIDDIGEHLKGMTAAQRIAELDRLEETITEDGDGSGASWTLFMPAFHHALATYGIPQRAFIEAIAGVRSDLEPPPDGWVRYETWDDAELYCRQVASTVGVASIRVFGAPPGPADALAVMTGTAFQLTNFLRDLREDHDMRRVYIPQADLREAGYTEADLAARVDNSALRALVAAQVARARDYYERSDALLKLVAPDSVACLHAMRRRYRAILEEIASHPEKTLDGSAEVSNEEWHAIEAEAQELQVKGTPSSA